MSAVYVTAVPPATHKSSHYKRVLEGNDGNPLQWYNEGKSIGLVVGKTLFPFDEDLQNAAKVLQSPTVRVLERSPSSVASSMEWVKAHAAEYKDKWIAVRDGKLIAEAPSFDELSAQVSLDSDTLVTKVL